MKRITITAEADIPEGMRIDKYLSERIGMFTRSQLKNLSMEIKMDGKAVKFSKKIEPGAVLELCYREPELQDCMPEALDLNVVFENDRVLVVDKPQGMVVHPGSGVRNGTLVQGLLHRILPLKERFPDEPLRPGIVHRLDKDTSGVIITAKDPQSHEFLCRQFRRRTTRKVYLALVKGKLTPPSGVVNVCIKRDPIHRKRFTCSATEGKPAVTEYRTLKEYGNHSFVLLSPKTGRTHQLRVHLKSLGAPIMGDPLYGKPDSDFAAAGLMLHSYLLTIVLPGEEQARTFRAALPVRMKDLLKKLAQV